MQRRVLAYPAMNGMRLILALMWLLHWLPLPLLGRLGHGVGSVLFAAARSRRHVTLTNLRLCFPEWTEEQRLAVARQHFQSYSRAMLERGILWWASEQRLRRLIVTDPPLPLAAIRSKPTILLCPHFVSLDVAGVAITLDTPGCSIYTAQRNRVFDAALRKGRTRFHPVALFSRAEGIKPVLRAMREYLPFFMLPDMDFGAKDAVFVPFFGVPAATLTAPAKIAALTGAQVIPVIATVLPDFKGWKVSFLEPWQDYPGPDLERATQRMNQFIEAHVRQNPAEYFWTHRRFKTRPPGDRSVYDPVATPDPASPP